MNASRRFGYALSIAITVAVAASAFAPAPATADAPNTDRIQITFDAGEAEAVLAIVTGAHSGPVDSTAWQRLFESRPYIRLKARESEMHRDFTDDEFKQFVLSPALAARADSLQRTLEAWKQTDLSASAGRVLAFLPDSARIRASVYPMIKPRGNSFVFQPSTDAAIFLYLDPVQSAAEFENTVAHEMHHIGFASVSAQEEGRFEALEPKVKQTVTWMGALGEGFAMLAAAGSADVHPHATSPAKERARWDRDMTHFSRDLKVLESFFLDVLNGKLKSDVEIQKAAFAFYGVQGPWYTVGYKMAVVVERRFGRPALIECMQDPRLLFVRYNAAATELNRKGSRLALWSPELLKRIRPPRPH